MWVSRSGFLRFVPRLTPSSPPDLVECTGLSTLWAGPANFVPTEPAVIRVDLLSDRAA